jgi:hypothetical protein
LDLLELSLSSTSLRAITLEYNWLSRFPLKEVAEQVHMVKELVASHRGYTK